MVAVPIPETYTVPQSYQPRRPDAADVSRESYSGPIPVNPPRTDAAGRNPSVPPRTAHPETESRENWNHYLAAGAFLAAGALLATGHRRWGIAAAAAGAATLFMEDSEAVTAFCQQAPAYLAEAQTLVQQAEELLHGCIDAAESLRR